MKQVKPKVTRVKQPRTRRRPVSASQAMQSWATVSNPRVFSFSATELRALVNAMSDVILVLDNTGRYLKIAPTNSHLLYRPTAEILGRRMHDVFPQTQADFFLRQVQNALAQQQTLHVEYVLEIDGRNVWFAAAVSPLTDRSVIWVARDITDHNRVQVELRESAERYRHISEMISDYAYAFRVEPDGTMHGEWITDSFSKVFGYTLHDVVERGGWQTLLHPADVDIARQHAQKAVSGQRDVCEFRFVTRDGDVRWLRDYVIPVWDAAQNRVTRLYGAAQDITERKHHERELGAQALIAQALGETLELQPLLERLIASAIHAVPAAQKGSLALLIDPEHLQVRALDGYQDPNVLGMTYPIGWGFAGRAVRERRAFLMGDIQSDAALQQDAQSATITEIQALRSAVVVPLMANEKTVGVLSLESAHPNVFSQQDLHLLTLIASTATLVIERARLFEDLRIRLKELETLHAVTIECVQAVDEDSLIERVTDLIGNNLYPNNFGFLLMNADRTALTPHSSYRGITKENIPTRISLQTGITGRVAASGKSYRTGDVRREPDYFEVNSATRSEVCVPVVVNGRVLGTINAESDKLDAFTKADEHLLGTAANLVATTLERIRLQEETRNRLRELEILQILSAALRQAHTIEEMIPIFIKHAVKSVQAQVGSIYLLEASSGDWVSYGWIDPQGEWVSSGELRHHPGEGVTGKVGASGEIYLTHDWRTDPVTRLAPGEENLLNELHSGISLPLQAERQTIGVMHIWYTQAHSFTDGEKRLLIAIANMAGNSLQRVRLFEETQRRLAEFNVLHQTSQTLLVSELDPEATYAAIHQAIAQTMPCEALSIVLEDQALGDYHAVYLYDKGKRYSPLRTQRGKGLSGRVIPSGKTLLIDDYVAQNEIVASQFGEGEDTRSILAIPLRFGDRTIGMVATQSYQPNVYTDEHRVLLETLAAQFATSIENARLYQQTRLRLHELEVVSAVSSALRAAPTHNEMFAIILDQLLALLNVEGAAIEMLDPTTGELTAKLGRGTWASATGQRIPSGAGLSAQVLATGKPYLNNDARNDPRLFRPDLFADCCAAAGVPLAVPTRTIGLLWIASQRDLTDHDLRLLTAVGDIAANAIHRATLTEQTERHLHRLATLHAIDRVISSSLDLKFTLNLLLEHTLTQLQADAASVLLLDPHTHTLEYVAARGFRTRAIEQTHLRLGESFAGRVALERQSIHVPNLAERSNELVTQGLAAEGYAEYYGVPLIAKADVVGVIEIFKRTPSISDPEWRDFCETLAGQAAIAIDNARLFGDLQQANLELVQAYDATIEGWSRALDLRDKETEGHTQRVSEMTLQLARVFGVSEDEIVHYRRGTLLHDIGKMSVPDRILFKAGALTDDEWKIMRAHPQHAYEMLSPIEYLRPALDIPYCHHEKWDGTGYPRGLEGEEIPLAARIFAVVDVWDALTSKRPYRAAWSAEQARAYIREQAGKHFDPRVVALFLEMFGTA